MPRRTLLLALGGAAVIAAVAIVLSVVLSGGGKKTVAPANIDGDISAVAGIPQHGLVLGNTLARVTLTEYIDTSCPICRQYVLSIFPTITRNYVRSGKVKVEARVLAFVGPSSVRGRTLVLAAAKQNKAFQLAELIYHNQGDEGTAWLTDDVARAFAAKIPGLDVDKLFADAKTPAVTNQATEMDAEAQRDQVGGTPTFIVTNPLGQRGLFPPGIPTAAAFASVFDTALKK